MIRSIHIRNFQSWKFLDLNLSAINVIIGETDQGKSAILRALGAVLFNTLEGFSFVRKGHSGASVIEVVTDEATVVLEKGRGVNRYIVNRTTYDKIGRGVPPEVSRALGVEEISFDDDTSLRLQFQPQADAPFLLADQGVKATRLVGAVSKVAMLYRAARESSTRKKDVGVRKRALEEVEIDAKRRVESYAYVDGLTPLVAEIEALGQRLEDVYNSREELSEIAETLQRTDGLGVRLRELIEISGRRRGTAEELCMVKKEREVLMSSESALGEYEARASELLGNIENAQALANIIQRLLLLLDRKSILEEEKKIVLNAKRAIAAYWDGDMLVRMAADNVGRRRVELEGIIATTPVCPVCGKAV